MKLSDYIIDGCKQTLSCDGQHLFTDIDEDLGEIVYADALGAAIFAKNGNEVITHPDYYEVFVLFPEINDTVLLNDTEYSLYTALMIMNDDLLYEREDIAKLLKEIGY